MNILNTAEWALSGLINHEALTGTQATLEQFRQLRRDLASMDIGGTTQGRSILDQIDAEIAVRKPPQNKSRFKLFSFKR